MRLPDVLYNALREQMGNHGNWHLARQRRGWLPVAVRRSWEQARQENTTLKFLDEAGSGEEFLTFHRHMVRHFKWLCDPANLPGHSYRFEPWTELPAWLAAMYPPGWLGDAYGGILRLIRYGTADELGSFIERTERDYTAGSGVHNRAHGYIARFEAVKYPNDPRMENAAMTDLSTAHFNEHFWGLHGWIDEIYAMWQRAHGQEVDQSPMMPHEPTGPTIHVTPGVAAHMNHSGAGAPAAAPGSAPAAAPAPAKPGKPASTHHH